MNIDYSNTDAFFLRGRFCNKSSFNCNDIEVLLICFLASLLLEKNMISIHIIFVIKIFHFLAGEFLRANTYFFFQILGLFQKKMLNTSSPV